MDDASERSHARMARWKTFLNRYDFVPEEAIWPAVATDLQHERSRPGVVDETLSRQLYFFLSGLSSIHDWHNMSARFSASPLVKQNNSLASKRLISVVSFPSGSNTKPLGCHSPTWLAYAGGKMILRGRPCRLNDEAVAAVLCPALFRMFLTYWKLFTVANGR